MTYGHRHYYDVDAVDPEPRCSDIGEGVCIRAWARGDDPEGSYFVAHDQPADDQAQSYRCEGRVDILAIYRSDANGGRRPGPTWERAPGTSLAAGNLTLTPSIRCIEHDGRVPGGHGFITEGRWTT